MENSHQKHMTPPSQSVCSWNENNGEFLRKLIFRISLLVKKNRGKGWIMSLKKENNITPFLLTKPLCYLQILLMCLCTLSSWTRQDTSRVWHLLLGGRLINTTAEYITVGMCVMFCQKIQIWFQPDFRRLLASNIFFKRSCKPQK